MQKSTAVIAKISRPAISGTFARNRLFSMLDDCRKRPIVWVSGPAGSGKTTLIANYLDHRGLPCLWYQADESDADLPSFFYYLGQAGQKAAPRIRKPLPFLTPEYLHGITTFTRRYFETLFSRLKPPFALVIDNYQQIPPEAKFHEIFQEAIFSVPQGITVILISRSESPPAYARLQMNQAIGSVTWSDIQFTRDEAEGFICSMGRGALTPEALNAVYEITQGWAAGLVLMTEAGRTKGKDAEIAAQSTPDQIFQYFAGELFDKIDTRTQHFLLKTALLPRVTVHAAEQLSGLREAGQVLSDLNQRNYFIVKHTQPEVLYQYHPLFKDFLLSRATIQLGDKVVCRLQGEAASLMEQAGQREDALELYLDAGAWTEAARLMIQLAPSLIASGRYGSVQKRIGRLPQDVINTQSDLLFWKAASLMPFDPVTSRRQFEEAFEVFKAAGNVPGVFQAWTGIVESLLHELGDLRKLDHWIETLDELIKDHPIPAGIIGERVASIMFMSLIMRKPDHVEFERWREQASLVLKTGTDGTVRMFTGFYLLTYYLWTGDFRQAAYLLEILRGIAGPREASPLAWITVKMAASWHLWLTGSTEASLTAMSDGLKTAREDGVHIWDYLLLIQGAAASLSAGDIPVAQGFLNNLSPVAQRARLFDRFYYYHEAAWCSLLQNDPAAARVHQDMAVRLAREVGSVFIEASAQYGMAQVRHEQGDTGEAREHLARARQIGAPLKSNLLDCACLLTQAYFLLSTGKKDNALECLASGMSLAKKHHFVNFTFWRPSVMSWLCLEALDHGIEVEYVRELISRRKLLPPARAGHPAEQWPWPLKIHSLGRFDLAKDGKPMLFPGKVQKPLALLKVLIALGGRDVSEEQFVDILWPDADGDLAHKSFEMTVQRLRRLLNDDKLIQLQERRLSLNPGLCWLDLWELEALIERVDEAWKNGGPSGDGAGEAVRLGEKAITLYRGHFLPGESAHAWALSCRERHRSKFLRLIMRLGGHWEQQRQWQKAIEVFHKGMDVDSLVEELHQHLMICYHELGQRAEAVSVYNRCRSLLVSSLGIPPSRKTEDLYQLIMK